MNKYVFIISLLILVLSTILLIICVQYELPVIMLLLCLYIMTFFQYSMLVVCAKISKKRGRIFGLEKVRLEDKCPIVISSSFISTMYTYLSYNEILKIKNIDVIKSDNIYITTLEEGIYYMYYNGNKEEVEKEIYECKS